MAISTIVKNKRDGVLTIKDGTSPTAKTFTVNFSEGDLRIVPHSNSRPILIRDNQGARSHYKKGDEFEAEGTVSFSFKYCDRNAKQALLCGTVDSQAWTSTAASDSNIPSFYKTVDIDYQIYTDIDAGTKGEKYAITKVWFNPGSIQFAEGDEANTLSAEGLILGDITEAADS